MSDRRTRAARSRSGRSQVTSACTELQPSPSKRDDKGESRSRSSNVRCPSPDDSDSDQQADADPDVVSDGASSVNEYSGPNASCEEDSSASGFYIGMKLEVKDVASDVWYGAKVSEVDWGEKEVLIHFENWSHRFDEWLPVQSSRLRHITKLVEQEEQSSPPALPTSEPPTETKDDKKFNVGDRVMATWNDCRRYSAKVTALLPNNRYQVVFYDGFSKNLRASKMSKLKPGQVDEASEKGPSSSQEPFKPVPAPAVNIFTDLDPDDLMSKEERRQRKRKHNFDSLFPKKKKLSQHFDHEPRTEVPDKRTAEETVSSRELLEEEEKPKEVESKSPADVAKARRRSSLRHSTEERADTPLKQEELSVDEVDGKSHSRKRSQRRKGVGELEPLPSTSTQARKQREGGELSRMKKSPTGEVEEATSQIKVQVEEKEKEREKWQPEGEEAYIVESTEGLRKSIILSDNRLPPGWNKHTIQRKSGSSAGKWDVFLVSPEGRKVRTRAELRQYFEECNLPFPSDCFDFALGRRKGSKMARSQHQAKSSRSGIGGKIKPSEESTSAASDQQPLPKRIKTLLPRIRTPQPDVDSLVGDAPPAVSSAPALLQPPQPVQPYSPVATEEGEVFVGGLKIQMENNAFKCPKEGCGKTFRKENLLQMHLKHYHPEYTQFVASTPNVADLAYARTIGESLEELLPRARPVQDIQRRKPPTKERQPAVTVPKKQIKRDESAADTGTIGSSAAVSRSSTGSASIDMEFHTATERAVETPVLPDEKEAPSPQPPAETVLSPLPSSGTLTAPSIKTLLPVIGTAQSPSSPPISIKEEIDVDTSTSDGYKPQTSSPPRAPITHSVPKASRGVRKRNLSGPPLDHAIKKRKLESVGEEVGEGLEDESCSLDGFSPTSRLPRRKPVVDLHKLNIAVDGSGHGSRGSGEGAPSEEDVKPTVKVHKKKTVEQLRRDELINCTCGYLEEDGLMIQCDVCLCWQHGVCNNIEKEEEVPDKYVCSICLNPPRARASKKYLHDQDWLKEGKLPSMSFRPKNPAVIAQREMNLKRSHELTGMLLQLQHAIHSLRVKLSIAEKSDHPKLYLWAKSWEKSAKPEMKHEDVEEDKKLDEKLDEAYSPSEATMKTELTGESPGEDSGREEECETKEINVEGEDQKEDASLLHQALTVRGQDAMLQLPICQSELMRFASSMADKLQAAESPRAPQPEAPIDPVECRLNLLDHINHSSQLVDSRLSSIEAQIAALESQDADFAKDETPDFFPKTKQTVQMLMRDLLTMQRIAAVN